MRQKWKGFVWVFVWMSSSHSAFRGMKSKLLLISAHMTNMNSKKISRSEEFHFGGTSSPHVNFPHTWIVFCMFFTHVNALSTCELPHTRIVLCMFFTHIFTHIFTHVFHTHFSHTFLHMFFTHVFYTHFPHIFFHTHFFPANFSHKWMSSPDMSSPTCE